MHGGRVPCGAAVRVGGGRAADIHHTILEDAMPSKLKLNLDHLAVDSFSTSKTENGPAPAPVNPGGADAGVVTCMQTNCGRYLCCA